MSNKPRIAIELFHRDQISIEPGARDRLGWAMYHWAILLRPKDFKQIDASVSYDVTDGIQLDPATRTDLNPEHNWRFRIRRPVNPLATGHFLGAIEIGKLPAKVTPQQFETLLSQVTIPLKNQSKDAESIMDAAMTLAGNVMAKGPPKKIEDRFQEVR
nr:hypothetical protein B0A51_05589 [Rachicladosporium sp. CCFEE 5018]